MSDKRQIKGKKKPRLLNRKICARNALILIFVVWGALYLPNLSNTPRWYGDETITLACGQDLVKGLFANRAVWNTYVNPQFCYQPGYVFLVGLASHLSGQEIGWPRLLNSLAALGIAVACIRLLGRRFGITTGVLIAIAKKRLRSPNSLHEILQILSLTMFETMPINQLLTTHDPDKFSESELQQLSLL